MAAGRDSREGEDAQIEARRQRRADRAAHPLPAPEHGRFAGGEDLDRVLLLDAERSLGVETRLRHHLHELRPGDELGTRPWLEPQIRLAHQLVGFDAAQVRVVREDRKVAILSGRVRDRHDPFGVQRGAHLLQILERGRDLEAMLLEEAAVVVDDHRVRDRRHRDDRAVDREELERVRPEPTLVLGILREDLREVEDAPARGDVDGVGSRLDRDDVRRGALGRERRLHADPLLVEPWVGGDLEREVRVVSLLVFLGDELLDVDVKSHVLPERDRGRAARLDLGRLEFGGVLELARRLGGLRLRAAGLRRRARRAQEGGCGSGEEAELEQFSTRHFARIPVVRRTLRLAHAKLSLRLTGSNVRPLVTDGSGRVKARRAHPVGSPLASRR